MPEKVKLNRADLMRKVSEVVRSSTNEPAAELKAMGEALIAIADTLEGLSVHDARAVLRAAAIASGVGE